ncbi:MAG: GNAT family N-acetyltransferase [Ruminococcus sp.]|nr:GNAT family N-acetyltransferase [Ruminococcus sp.]
MIRKYEKNDHERVMEIWLNANVEAHGFIRREYWRDSFPAAAEAIPRAEVYVAQSEDGIVGFIGLNGGHIEGIFVDGEHRSEGVGKSLIDHAKGRYNRLSLCVYEKNTRAADFYLREGFLPVRKTEDISTGETEIFMRWEVRRTYNL